MALDLNKPKSEFKPPNSCESVFSKIGFIANFASHL